MQNFKRAQFPPLVNPLSGPTNGGKNSEEIPEDSASSPNLPFLFHGRDPACPSIHFLAVKRPCSGASQRPKGSLSDLSAHHDLSARPAPFFWIKTRGPGDRKANGLLPSVSATIGSKREITSGSLDLFCPLQRWPVLAAISDGTARVSELFPTEWLAPSVGEKGEVTVFNHPLDNSLEKKSSVSSELRTEAKQPDFIHQA